MSWKGWLALVVALPLLYFLSVPPLMLANAAPSPTDPFFPCYPLFENEWMALHYDQPYRWLAAHTSLYEPLDGRFGWWMHSVLPKLPPKQWP